MTRTERQGSTGVNPISPRPPGVVRGAAVVAVVGAVGSALLTVGHAGVSVPLISALGPGGSRPVWPAAIAFAVGTAAYATVATTLLRKRLRSVWTTAMAVFCLTVVVSLIPYRGPGSIVGAVLGAVGAGLLATRTARSTLSRRRAP